MERREKKEKGPSFGAFGAFGAERKDGKKVSERGVSLKDDQRKDGVREACRMESVKKEMGGSLAPKMSGINYSL